MSQLHAMKHTSKGSNLSLKTREASPESPKKILVSSSFFKKNNITVGGSDH